jgi:hypothetical protein
MCCAVYYELLMLFAAICCCAVLCGTLSVCLDREDELSSLRAQLMEP